MTPETFRPFSIETRFTRETGPNPITFHPLGYIESWSHFHDKANVISNYGNEWYQLQFFNNGPWVVLLGIDGSYMFKFLLPEFLSNTYDTHRFVYNGIWYVLDIRITGWND
jgi:hypothetical protein